jgi:hypothetical protein
MAIRCIAAAELVAAGMAFAHDRQHGFRSVRRADLGCWAPAQRVALADIEVADLREAEALVVNFHCRPALHLLGQLFDCEADGICAALEPAISHGTRPSTPRRARINLSGRLLVKTTH